MTALFMYTHILEIDFPLFWYMEIKGVVAIITTILVQEKRA